MSIKRLEHTSAAKLLLSSKAQNVLKPFLHNAYTVSQAAKKLGLPINKVAYWVAKLFRHRILEQCQLEPYPSYRAVAEAFFVPFSLTGKESMSALYISLQQPFLELFHQSMNALMNDQASDWGVCISLDHKDLILTLTDEARGGITLNSRQPDAPATVNLWGVLNLDFADAKAMQHELMNVFQKYFGRHGAQPYLLRLGNVPLQPQSNQP